MPTKKIIGWVAVDSGQLMITDPSYLSTWTDNEYGEGEKGDYSYGGACAVTIEEQGGSLRFPLGHEGAGVAFRSGLGDGMYPVVATVEEVEHWGERITKIEVPMVFDGRHPYEVDRDELISELEGAN